MSRYGTVPYVYKTRRVAVAHVVIGFVLAIFTAIFALAAFPDAGPDVLYIACGITFGVVSALSFFLGIGSLRGQQAEKSPDRA